MIPHVCCLVSSPQGPGSTLNEDVEMVYGYCALLIFRKQLPLACVSDDPFLNLANRFMHMGRETAEEWLPFAVSNPDVKVWWF